VVEGVVKFARLNFFVPVPQVHDLDELNGKLAERCREDLKRRLRGKTGTKAEMLKEDQAAFLALPEVAFDACRKQPTRANSLSLVRFDDNDYSVPVHYAHHEILIKGYVERVVLCHKDKVVAKHHRSWGKESSSITAIIYRFWSANLAPWITPCPWRISICQSALRRCGVAFLLKNPRRGKGQESSSGCCGCWKITL